MMNQNNENVLVYNVYPSNEFNENIRYYIKKKKYKHISKDIKNIIEELEKGVFQGDVISNLKLSNEKNNTYKVRAVNTDTQQGKSNGYRLIYYVENEERVVFLITIYYKKDEERIPSNHEIVELIKKVLN